MGAAHGRCSQLADTMGAAHGRCSQLAGTMGAAHGRCSQLAQWAQLAGKHHGRCSWALLAGKHHGRWHHGRCSWALRWHHGRWHHGLAGTMGAAHGCCKAPWHACKAPWHACKAHGPRHMGMAQGKARDAMAWPNTTCKGKAWPKQGMQRHGIHRHNDRTTCTMLRL